MYKDALGKEILSIIQEFFRIEQGNRVTVNNMNGLVTIIKTALDNNQVVDSNELIGDDKPDVGGK